MVVAFFKDALPASLFVDPSNLWNESRTNEEIGYFYGDEAGVDKYPGDLL